MSVKKFVEEVFEKYSTTSSIVDAPVDGMGIYNVERFKLVKKVLKEYC